MAKRQRFGEPQTDATSREGEAIDLVSSDEEEVAEAHHQEEAVSDHDAADAVSVQVPEEAGVDSDGTADCSDDEVDSDTYERMDLPEEVWKGEGGRLPPPAESVGDKEGAEMDAEGSDVDDDMDTSDDDADVWVDAGGDEEDDERGLDQLEKELTALDRPNEASAMRRAAHAAASRAAARNCTPPHLFVRHSNRAPFGPRGLEGTAWLDEDGNDAIAVLQQPGREGCAARHSSQANPPVAALTTATNQKFTLKYYIYFCMSINICIYVCTYIYVYICICIYIYTSLSISLYLCKG